MHARSERPTRLASSAEAVSNKNSRAGGRGQQVAPHGAVVVVEALCVGLPHVHLTARAAVTLGRGQVAPAVVVPEHHASKHDLCGLGGCGGAVLPAPLDGLVLHGELAVGSDDVGVLRGRLGRRLQERLVAAGGDFGHLGAALADGCRDDGLDGAGGGRGWLGL